MAEEKAIAMVRDLGVFPSGTRLKLDTMVNPATQGAADHSFQAISPAAAVVVFPVWPAPLGTAFRLTYFLGNIIDVSKSAQEPLNGPLSARRSGACSTT